MIKTFICFMHKDKKIVETNKLITDENKKYPLIR